MDCALMRLLTIKNHQFRLQQRSRKTLHLSLRATCRYASLVLAIKVVDVQVSHGSRHIEGGSEGNEDLLPRHDGSANLELTTAGSSFHIIQHSTEHDNFHLSPGRDGGKGGGEEVFSLIGISKGMVHNTRTTKN